MSAPITTPIIDPEEANSSEGMDTYCASTLTFKPMEPAKEQEVVLDAPEEGGAGEGGAGEEAPPPRYDTEWNYMGLPFSMVNLSPHYASTEHNGSLYAIGDVYNRLLVTNLMDKQIREFRCVGLHSREGCGSKLLVYGGLLICLSPSRAFATELPKTWGNEKESASTARTSGPPPAAASPAGEGGAEGDGPPPSGAPPAGAKPKGGALRTARNLLNPGMARAGARLERLFSEMQSFDESQVEKRISARNEAKARGDDMDLVWTELPVTERVLNSVDVQAGCMWGKDTLACFGGTDTTGVFSIDLKPFPALYALKKSGQKVKYSPDAPSLRWKIIQARNKPPQSRSDHCTHILEDDLFVFSGKNAGIIRCDMWVFNLRHGLWRSLGVEGRRIPTLLFTSCICTPPYEGDTEGEEAFRMTAYGKRLMGKQGPFALSLEIKFDSDPTDEGEGEEGGEAAAPPLPNHPSAPPASASSGPPPPPLPPLRGAQNKAPLAKLEDMRQYRVVCSKEPGCPARSTNAQCAPSAAYSSQGMTYLLGTTPWHQDWGLGLFCAPRPLGQWTMTKHTMFTEYYRNIVAAWMCAMLETDNWLPMELIQHTLSWYANEGRPDQDFEKRGLPEVERILGEQRRKFEHAKSTDWTQ